jgi:gamma-glutamyltranspeptidase/glutathione hydrolase
MEAMHQRYGTLAWADLFQDAINLAENGFKFHPSVSMYIAMIYDMFGFDCSGDSVLLFRDPTAKEYFLSENCTAPVSHDLTKSLCFRRSLVKCIKWACFRLPINIYNQEYANTLRSIASGGADVFYSGDIAYNM